MSKSLHTNRRFFLKSLTTAGLLFSGIDGFAQSSSEPEKVKMKHWDVVVIGGGPGGVPAAVAAARNGARVLLVERYGFLGGMATSALVQPYMKYNAGDKIIIRGLFEEFVDIMLENGAILENRKSFDAEPMKWLLDRFVMDAGVDMLLHTSAIGVLKDGKTIKAVKVFHKGGIEDISADIFIDSTGDGDIATWAGAPFEIGREFDNAFQPMTTSFRMANVDVDRVPPRDEINELYDKAKAEGTVKNPRENVLKFKTIHKDVVHFNTTRIIGKSSLDGWESTDAEIEGRRQVDDMVRFLKKNIRGFENSYLMKMGAQIGVRESRRIMGHYKLTKEDVIETRKFDDAIVCASYEIDIHNPTGTGTEIHYLKDGTYYQIPYRSIIPLDVENLIIASRCISSDHAAHSSLRVQPIVWGIGQAAGTAAAIALKDKKLPAVIDTQKLKNTLIDQGAFI